MEREQLQKIVPGNVVYAGGWVEVESIRVTRAGNVHGTGSRIALILDGDGKVVGAEHKQSVLIESGKVVSESGSSRGCDISQVYDGLQKVFDLAEEQRRRWEAERVAKEEQAAEEMKLLEGQYEEYVERGVVVGEQEFSDDKGNWIGQMNLFFEIDSGEGIRALVSYVMNIDGRRTLYGSPKIDIGFGVAYCSTTNVSGVGSTSINGIVGNQPVHGRTALIKEIERRVKDGYWRY